jgi:hypothetical protein
MAMCRYRINYKTTSPIGRVTSREDYLITPHNPLFAIFLSATPQLSNPTNLHITNNGPPSSRNLIALVGKPPQPAGTSSCLQSAVHLDRQYRASAPSGTQGVCVVAVQGRRKEEGAVSIPPTAILQGSVLTRTASQAVGA